jgi:hypothetical protein
MSAGDGSDGAATQKLYKTRYTWLHRAEEARLLSTATSMTLALQQLILVVRVYGHAQADFARFFAEAEDGADAIYAEMLRGVYYYAPRTYAGCREKLDEGMRRLEAGNEKTKEAGGVRNFEELKAKGERCQACFDAYANAWSAILQFDKANSNAWWQRWYGRHAFEQKASTGEMLLLLQQMRELARGYE